MTPLEAARAAQSSTALAGALLRYGQHDQDCEAEKLIDGKCRCGLTPLARKAKEHHPKA